MFDVQSNVLNHTGVGKQHSQAQTSELANIRGLLVPTSDIASPKYDPEEHSKYKFWSPESWAPYSTGGRKSDMATSPEGVPIYLEDATGNVFTPAAYAELRSVTKRLFCTLADHGLAPPTWRSRNIHASRYMQAELYKSFPTLAHCEGHFRVHALITRMYPDFVR
ncbi:hypothetical protein BC628DRAFT_1325603, partial [Trametes gibbosa]